METLHNQPILIVEDSEVDYTTTVRALRKNGVNNPLFHCVDGDEAIDFLHRRGKFAELQGKPLPVLVLLDLNLPATDGRAVLKHVKTNETLCSIPVIVLSTSQSEQDINECYLRGANSYLVKAVDFAQFTESIRLLKAFWLETAALPIC